MARRKWTLLLLMVLAGASLVVAEEPPYKRVLQGDDAKKGETLQKRIDELWAAAKFAQAAAPAEELLALRKRAQGEGHWEVADTARVVETLRRAARLPVAQQQALAAVPPMSAKAQELYAQGKYAQAEPLFRKGLAVYEEVLGPKHPDTATCYNNLAVNLESQGRAKEAEPLKRQALAVREEVLGPKHPDTAASYGNLATNLDAQGRAKEAEPLYRKAVAIKEEVLGPKHPGTALSYNHLAYNLGAQGRAREAEPLFRQALAVREEVLGPKHSHTAESYNNLAFNLQAQGRAQEAEPLYRKALAVYEEVRGPRHPDTATICNNLAYNLEAQGRAREAEPLYRKSLAVREEVLGPKHPNTAAGYNNLAVNLDAQGRALEGEPLHRHALAVCEEVLGPKHPHTAASYNTLAANLQAQGRAWEAEPLYRKALALREEVLGPKHPDTARSYISLATNLDAQGRAQEAEPLFRKALTVWEAVLGPKHPDTARSYINLAYNLSAQGRAKEAEPLFRKALALAEEVLGSKHPDTAASYHNLAANLQVQGLAHEGEPLYRQALAIFEEVLGPRHPDTATGYNSLAYNLDAQGRGREAEPLYRKALAIKENVLGLKHPATAGTYSNLAANLQAQGQAREAEPLWQAAADGIEVARLRLAASTLDRAAAIHVQPHLGLAACRARLDRPTDAWSAAEAGLARGLLDDLAALGPDPDEQRRDRRRAARLDALDRLLTPLLTKDKLAEEQRRRRDDLLRERRRLDSEAAGVAAERSGRAVLPLADVQAALAADAALVFWVDLSQSADHWGCVVRRSGLPAWVRLPGSGHKGSWTEADAKLPRRLHDDLAHNEPDVDRRAHAVAAQRLDPLVAHLGPRGDLPAIRRLIVVPVGVMAGLPVEVLTDKYLVSYVPSGSVFTHLHEKHRPLESPSLLALGDPNFTLPGAAPLPEPPAYGLYLPLVLPDGNAARAGLRAGDTLLSYAGRKLSTKADLKIAEGGDPVPVIVWRDGKTLHDMLLAPGKLGVLVSDDPPAVALRKRRELELLADARTRSDIRPLPGTRLEVAALAGLLPEGQSTLLLGSKASEQELDALAASSKLKSFRLLHLATHGSVDPVSAAHSALELARDQLPGPDEQARLAAAGKKVATGRLSVETIAKTWELDADLVTLSACETALGPEGGGEGLLGFSQVLLGRGARSLLLSLWKVDDTATALLMTRFYEDLLGKREGLDKPLPKAEALREAKRWLRTLPRAEVEKLASRLAKGELRAKEEPKGTQVPEPVIPRGDTPFAHPRYWAAFILIGDPE
jgi:tetratricopeptide (TPR) repeat protein